ncbi:hypothetical protein [Nocardioides mesophilus]|uniref:Uncharacterized protein n=1 Tax=Nocardioides mesophilus TaxID=433659 RepID=A0A7G9RDS3_9ACTN|nr:hypothetical protein [Nocardioides mesophilus]QNN53748.1 hypothetical protein H9L09_04865 [Nocardioides mesophilus]
MTGLKDNDSDGHWVYVTGKIGGSGWSRTDASMESYGGHRTKKYVWTQIYASARAQQGKIQACRHRVGVIPNLCTESAWKCR